MKATSPKATVSGSRALTDLLNGFFFLFAGVASLWLLWIVFRDTENIHWLLIVYLVVLWAILAYWVLPRFHKVLTSLYVPNYFIGRSRTSYGLLGDPVNLAFDGSEENLHKMMQAAGWTLAEPVNFSSSMKIIGATLTRKSYPTAPVSTLEVFNRIQDFAYQQEVDGSPGKRHHVRFWRCPDDWPLPGGRRVDWVAAGSYDRAVGLSLFTLQVTHKIGADIDKERDHVVATLRSVEPTLPVEVIKDFSTAYHSRNGGGDMVQTDGNLPIIGLGHVPDSLPQPDLSAIEEDSDERSHSDRRLRHERRIPRPIGIYAAAALIALLVCQQLLSIIRLATDGAGQNQQQTEAMQQLVLLMGGSGALWLVGCAAVLVMVAWIVLGIMIWSGYPGARLTLVILTGFYILYSFQVWVAKGAVIDLRSNLLGLTVSILLLIALTSTPVTEFALARVQLRKYLRSAPTAPATK